MKQTAAPTPIIFHIDVNSAFLSWEAVYRLRFLGASLDLRQIPSAIGGDQTLRHGIILAKSIPAKRFGVKTGQTISEALACCPHLVLAPPNYSLYEQCSAAFMATLHQYSPDVEQYSIDEAFLDMTGTQTLFGPPEEAAQRLRQQIARELGFTVNIGISSNRLLAKMASDFQKPDRVHTLYPREISQKLWPLPVSDLFFIGRATTARLFSLGIHTIGQLAHCDPILLRSHLKKQGEVIWAFANGTDCSSVSTVPVPNKGYGNSTTISFDVTDPATAKLVLLGLSETIARRIRQDHVRILVVSVGIRTYRLEYSSHQCILPAATNLTGEIHQAACRLFDQLWDGTPIRHLGIHTSRVLGEEESCRQTDLFDHMDYTKWEQMERTVDELRYRFGMDCIKRSSFLKAGTIDHLSGGISREKRTVDYETLNLE